MDHPLALDPIRPWRTTALVASVVAIVELVVIVVAGVALLGEPLARKAKDVAMARTLPAVKPSPKPVVPRPEIGAPTLGRAETSVLVLNGNGRSGAAADGAALVRSRGYLIGGSGNAKRSDYARSLVMYRPGFEAEGRRLAADLKIEIVGPLDGMAPKELLGAHLALVLGAK